MTLGDLYSRMCNQQTIMLYGENSIFIDRVTIGTIPTELLNRQVNWILVDPQRNLEIYLDSKLGKERAK